MIDERLKSAVPGVKWGEDPDFVTRMVYTRACVEIGNAAH